MTDDPVPDHGISR